MGLGTTIGFNNGLLNLVYGLGSSFGEPTLLRTGKIHIGFTSFFLKKLNELQSSI